jgi:hypothetical protein
MYHVGAGNTAIMGYKVNFDEPRARIVLVGKGSNGDLVLQERARASGRAPLELIFAPFRFQEPIDGCRAHGDELCSLISTGCNLLEAFKHRQGFPDEGGQTLATEASSKSPELLEQAQNIWSIGPRAFGWCTALTGFLQA